MCYITYLLRHNARNKQWKSDKGLCFENSSLPGCDAVLLGEQFPVFKRRDDTFEMSWTAHLQTQHHVVGDLDAQ